ncbi:oxysterol-binding protein 1-like [Hydractinia symbiolongicarpus]|uniref:oxysterol-binding protein 1-like n=1 Tax=Hydractinia symbiolongicarpus TaxID=13093 RepID=UPI00254DB17A|nr:oxysterol-binding protein 1-like [Hydractinia symbiolongicarpus]XP_057304090.1 oxysterol-binding protein 1-like [Hydractinia symbiolongicarpus]
MKKDSNSKEKTDMVDLFDDFGKTDDLQLLKKRGINFPKEWRKVLPSTRDKYNFSLIAFLRTTIGKDLTKVPMPVCFNEPISFLQRLTEDVEYADLLNKAADCTCTVERLAYIAAFASSNYANVPGRFWKPFNPLLGETFEFHHKEHNYSVIAEQVSHHPPISVIHVESDKWVFWQEYKLDTKFRGMYVKVCPTGNVHLKMKSDNVHYSWKKPSTTIHNIVFGTLWVDHDGSVEITSKQTKETAVIHFRPHKKVSKDFLKLSGSVSDKNGEVQYHLEGGWMENLHAEAVEGTGRESLHMWEAMAKPEDSQKMFGLTSFAIHLNEKIDDIKCPTDSRFRPDQRLLEEGFVDEASDEKYRLEEKQRAGRKKREQNKEIWRPRWFTLHKDEDTGVVSHVYKGGYWEAKLENNFTESPDIF